MKNLNLFFNHSIFISIIQYFHSVGRPKHQKLLVSKTDSTEVQVGKKAEVNKGLLKLRYPMEHGIIKDWGDMEALWNYAYIEMKANQLEHPVLLTEAVLNPYSNRERMAEIFFETYTAPAIFICSQALLSLYSSGKPTGVVLECGDGVCQCAPVYDGYILNNTAQRIDLGGRDVTEYMNLLLRRGGNVFYTSVFSIRDRNYNRLKWN